MVDLKEQPKPEIYNSVPYFEPNNLVSPFTNTNDYARFKVGDQYFIYDTRKTSPFLITLHALVNRFERFLQGSG